MKYVEVETWRQEQLYRSAFSVKTICVDEMQQWSFKDGNLVHASGGFFSVVGLKFHDRPAVDSTVGRPFIQQPETGILGFLLTRQGDDICLLVQAKTEPGNPGGVQLAPSFQCTESNFRRRHGGSCAPFYEFFDDRSQRNVLSDSLQSEQGTRFIDKYNRNMLVEVAADTVDLERANHAAWTWMSFGNIRDLIQENLLFNTDARSVIAVSNWEMFCTEGKPFERWAGCDGFGHELWKTYHQTPSAVSVAEIGDWLESRRKALSATTEILPLDNLLDWEITDTGIVGRGASTIAVRYYAVRALDREVPRWWQPMITSATHGEVMLVAQMRSGELKFLVLASHEPGFANTAQLSVPFQIFPGDTLRQQADPNLQEVWEGLSTGRFPVLIDCLMSEEGGRFYHDVNRYLLVLAPPNHRFPDTDATRWLTLGEITALKRTPGMFTNEFRSGLSMLVQFL